MIVKDIKDEDFINYKKPSMFISTAKCDWKCCIEQHLPIETCQNSEVAKMKNVNCPDSHIISRYLYNNLTEAIVFGGLEPFKQFHELFHFISLFRQFKQDDIVIYTGYTETEAAKYATKLKQFPNIIIKYGRYVPNQTPHLDLILGVKLASHNQYAKKIS